MDKLRLFSTQADYEDEVANLEYPTVSYVEGTEEIAFMTPPDYSTMYLTFDALESGTITLTIPGGIDSSEMTSVSYSTDNGETWVTTQADFTNQTITIPVNTNDKVLWKGVGDNMSDHYVYSHFSSTGNFKVYGNIMSLLYGDNFYDKTTFPSDSIANFGGLFNGADKLTDAKNLILPATTLTNYCYENMFYGCTSLTIAPATLPATTLTNSCYNHMFQNCTSLIIGPDFYATTIAVYSCACMFYNCTSLTTAPSILPATTLQSNCYNSMFYGCTLLTTAPILPAMSLTSDCYREMFNGCTSLNYVKALFITTPTTSSSNGNGHTYRWLRNVASTGTFIKSMVASWSLNGDCGVPNGWTSQYEAWPENINYFSTKAIDDSTFTLTIGKDVEISRLRYVEYSLDDGDNWTRVDNVASQITTVTTSQITAGNSVKWRCAATSLGYNSITNTRLSVFSSTGRYSVEGDITSLTCGNNSRTDNAFCYLFNASNNIVSCEHLVLPTDLNSKYCCGGMFYNCTALTTAPTTLPATTLTDYCYAKMFSGCTSLTTTPTLPATTLTNHCYSGMFYNCTSLTSLPELPATTLATYCYGGYPSTTYDQGMFQRCTGLTTIPNDFLPATNLDEYCYSNMFKGCTGLTTLPSGLLPATTMKRSCYSGMFQNCTGLTTIPNNFLPATTLAQGCYGASYTMQSTGEQDGFGGSDCGMFSGCTSLTTVPSDLLSATNLAYSCYNGMFSGCTSLTTAPVLPATTLASYCYCKMFNGCTGLTTIPNNFLPATTTATGCYGGMFHGCTSLTTPPALPATVLTDSCYENMFYGCTRLNSSPQLPATTLAEKCYQAMYYNTNIIPDCTNIDFTSSTVVNSGGLRGLFWGTKVTDAMLSNILPKDGNNRICLPVTTLTKARCYQKMFYNCSLITTTPELPATTLSNYCYYDMFWLCTSLTTIPTTLPATTLTNSCYWYMFNKCTSLTTVPSGLLPATTLAQSCYYGLFSGCTKITVAPDLNATTLASGCYQSMFNKCTSLTTAPILPATTLASSCYKEMFSGCTALTTAPDLPATTLVSSCYGSMFQGCTNLNYIKAMFTTTPSSTYTSSWVYNVGATGTFVKNSAANWNVTGTSGVPSGWTVQTASE